MLLDGLKVVTRDGKTSTKYNHWMGSALMFASELCMWRKAGVVKERTKSTLKIGDRGVTCMFVRYKTNYGNNIYMMWNPNTNKIHNTVL